MPTDWKAFFTTIGQEASRLIPQIVSAYAAGRAEEKDVSAFNQKINKLETVISKVSPTKAVLTTGILGNESQDDLGRRKWTEYEKFLKALPDNATPTQVQQALSQIQNNITKDYPCEDCRENSIESLKKFPLSTSSVSSKKDAEKRLCQFHNIVREMQGKEITHNCDVIFD